MAQAQPENQMEGGQCTVGKIINKWVRDKREKCLEMKDVDGKEEVFSEKVHDALNELYNAYEIRQLIKGIQDTQYEDPIVQFGYIYKHSMFSARCLSKIMHCFHAFENLANQTSITVACLGGGPGSDAMGVLDFFMKYMGDFEGQLNIRLYDRKDKWGPCWESLQTAMDAELDDPRVTVSFHDFDVTVADIDSDTNKPDLQNADVITMHYFMEEVYSERAKAEVKECFKYILQTAKPGALFLYSGMYFEQVINWVHHQLLEAKCKVLPRRPGVPTRDYEDDRTNELVPIPCLPKFKLREEGDLKLFDDIRKDLNRRGNMDLVKVSQRLNLVDGQLVFRLYQK